MVIRKFFSAPNIILLFLILTFFSPLRSWGQEDLERKIIDKQKQITDAVNRMNDVIGQADADINQISQRLEKIKEALNASTVPDNRTVGVYLSIGRDNEVSPKEWGATIEKYFTAYGFPMKIVLDHIRPEGKGAIAIIYVGAKAYEGNLSNGSVSLSHLLTKHENVFGELLEMYKKANPDLFSKQDN